MPEKPIIGINCDYRPAHKEQSPQAVSHAGYFEGVSASGGVPLLIPSLTDRDDLAQILDLLDGLILTGGGDLDPKRMGVLPHPSSRVMPPRREDCDRLLCEMALKRRMPILAVGVGMQTVNVVGGGSLHLHILEDLPRAMPHHDPLGGSHRHCLEMVPGTRIEQIYGDGEIRVNSSHRQAVNKVAAGFQVTATAPDGVVEAIEAEDDDWFCLCVQWHPESETASALDMQVFEAFGAAAAGKDTIKRRSSRKSAAAKNGSRNGAETVPVAAGRKVGTNGRKTRRLARAAG
jgi:putative glutamine amidotransferase